MVKTTMYVFIYLTQKGKEVVPLMKTVTNLTQQRLGYQDSKLHTLLDETFKCINAGKTELAKKKLSEFFLYGENANPPLKAMAVILKNMIDRQMAHS